MLKNILAIDEVDPCIAQYHASWAKNRAMIAGERVVKPAGRAYLPFPPIPNDMGDRAYRQIVQRTPFVPAAARSFEGLKGLIFRKPSTIVCPDAFRDVLDTVTSDGYSLDDLAEDVVSEFMITNFVGLLTDYPVAPVGLSAAQAIDLGARPFVNLYPAESILGIETGVINNRQRVIRVRLQEDCDTIRELRLIDQVYSVTKWVSKGGAWTAVETITPTKAGKPLDEVPFSLVTSNRKFLPAKAKLDDICDLNAQHYIASANLAQVEFYAGNPTPYLFGTKIDGLALGPGNSIISEANGAAVKIGMLEPDGTSINNLREGINSITNEMAKVGSRILAAEKDSVEAAETIAIKTASEDAVLASTARLCTRWINDQMQWVSWWLDLAPDAISYDLNTDYGDSKMDALTVEANTTLWQDRVISRKTLCGILVDGNILPANYDADADFEQIQAEDIDRPPVTSIIPNSTSIIGNAVSPK